MDSVITQVRRPDENRESPGDHEVKTSYSPEVSITDKQSKSSRSTFLQRLFCCGQCRKKKKKSQATEPHINEELLQTESTNGSVAMVTNSNSTSGSLMMGGMIGLNTGMGNGDANEGFLLPLDINPIKSTLVIDLDETLVHSSFKPIPNADFIVPVEIDGTIHQVYVAKRPYVDEFLQKMGPLYECVLFTASLAKYADPVADLLDKWGVFKARLFREACVFHRGNYVKDLNRLGRRLERVIIIDNSPASYIFHPDNSVPVASWFDSQDDSELLFLIPFFERLASVDNVYSVLRNSNHPFNTPPSGGLTKEFIPGNITSPSPSTSSS